MNKVQTVKNSLGVTISSIKQTQMTSINGYSGDERPRREDEVERIDTNIEIGAQSEIDQETRRRAKHRDENETNKAKIETFLGFGETKLHSQKYNHEGKGQGQVFTKTSLC